MTTKMSYGDLEEAVSDAWDKFFDLLEERGIDTNSIWNTLNKKDCFNDVFDAVMASVVLEDEEEE